MDGEEEVLGIAASDPSLALQLVHQDRLMRSKTTITNRRS